MKNKNYDYGESQIYNTAYFGRLRGEEPKNEN